jgi:hypothetical protein
MLCDEMELDRLLRVAKAVQDSQATISTSLKLGPTRKEIELRAYQIYAGRGAVHGFDLQDWLQAERELEAMRPARDGKPFSSRE